MLLLSENLSPEIAVWAFCAGFPPLRSHVIHDLPTSQLLLCLVLKRDTRTAPSRAASRGRRHEDRAGTQLRNGWMGGDLCPSTLPRLAKKHVAVCMRPLVRLLAEHLSWGHPLSLLVQEFTSTGGCRNKQNPVVACLRANGVSEFSIRDGTLV